MTRARNSPGTRLLGVLAVLALVFGVVRFTDAGRAFAVRSFVRAERLWSRDLPLPAARGALRTLVEPALTAVGILRPVRIELEPGVSLLLDPADDVGRTILISRTGTWESDVWQALSGGLGDGSVAVDVGAHIGVDTLKLAHTVGPHGRVVAVEPNPLTVSELRENIRASGASNVTVAPVALADVEGELTLFDARKTGNSGASSLSARNAGDVGASYKVRARRLDDVVGELGLARVDVVKADVEGAELLVLRGGVDTLSRFHPRLVLEVVPRQLENMGASVQELETFLAAHGYARQRWIDYKNKEYQFGPAADAR